MLGKERLGNLHFVWGTSGSKNLLDQVSAFRPSHFYVVQAVYLSQPPFCSYQHIFGVSDLRESSNQIRDYDLPWCQLRWYMCRNLLLVSAYSIQQKKVMYIKNSF